MRGLDNKISSSGYSRGADPDMLVCSPQAAEVKDSLDVVSKTNRGAVGSQKKIDQLAWETRDMLEEYRKLQDGTEYQAAYTRELEELDGPSSRRLKPQ